MLKTIKMHNTIEIKKDASITATFWRYTVPAVAAMIVNGLYQLVDGIFVGHYIGADGLAAINIAWPVTTIVGGFGLMIGMGAGSLISIYRGENNSQKARTAMFTALLLCIGVGVLGSLYLLGLDKTLVDLQGATGAARQYALNYLEIFSYGAIITVAAGALPFLIRNDDSPMVATAMMVIGALLNIVLDYVFIGLFGWDLFGAAFATILAQLSTLFLGIVYLCSPYSKLSIFKHPLQVSFSDGKQSLKLGLSSLTMFMYYGVLIAFHNKLFVEYGSPISVAAFAIVGYLMALFYVLAEGVAEGMQPQVSFYHGAKQFDKIVKVVKLASLVSVMVGLTWIAVLNFFPEESIQLFNGNDNQALTDEATTGIRLHLSMMFLDGLIVIASMYFLSVNKGGTSLAISLSNMFAQLPFLYILPQFLGLEGVWLAMPISNIVLASIIIPMMWRHILRQRSQKYVGSDELITAAAIAD